MHVNAGVLCSKCEIMGPERLSFVIGALIGAFSHPRFVGQLPAIQGQLAAKYGQIATNYGRFGQHFVNNGHIHVQRPSKHPLQILISIEIYLSKLFNIKLGESVRAKQLDINIL